MTRSYVFKLILGQNEQIQILYLDHLLFPHCFKITNMMFLNIVYPVTLHKKVLI